MGSTHTGSASFNRALWVNCSVLETLAGRLPQSGCIREGLTLTCNLPRTERTSGSAKPGSGPGCHVFARQLRYPHGWPDNADGQGPQEKGIDVRMALDIALLAYRGEYDVAIICSGDTDLIPAIEEVLDGEGSARVEVAGWRSERYRQRLSMENRNIWCHWLRREDYERVRDDTDYPSSG